MQFVPEFVSIRFLTHLFIDELYGSNCTQLPFFLQPISCTEDWLANEKGENLSCVDGSSPFFVYDVSTKFVLDCSAKKGLFH